MCYTVPGKVVSVEGKNVSLDYFGEVRNAVNEFFELKLGDYAYAQGGIIIERVDKVEAEQVLRQWKNKFDELKRTDLKLSRMKPNEILNKPLSKSELAKMLSSPSEQLYMTANYIRHEHKKNSCCVHGIIEFSNYCSNDCAYCGIRRSNSKVKRYRMTEKDILDNVAYASDKLGFKAIVLQSGEDDYYSEDFLAGIVEKIMQKHNILVFMSCGTRTKHFYKRMYDAGARGILLRFETSNEKLYKSLHPCCRKSDLGRRVSMLRYAKRLGYLVATGFIFGLPGQTAQDIINDIIMTKNLNADMYSMGPFIPHPCTPLGNCTPPSQELGYSVIAVARIIDPNANILVTTALETLDKEGLKKGMMSGANSFMINVTSKRYINDYNIYPRDVNLIKEIDSKISVIKELGRAPTDISID